MAGRAGRPGLGQTGMTRGATVSAALHVVVLLALVLVIPPPAPPPTPPDDAMEVEFEGTAASAQKSQNHGHVAAAAEAEKPATEDPALTAPKPQPLETAPPPPPPPPPPPQAAQSVTQTLTPARLVVPPPDREAEALRPPPPMKVAAAAPPMPTPTPVAPKKPVLQPTDSKPVDSVRHQPNKTKNASPDTHSLLATLEKFSADPQEQDGRPEELAEEVAGEVVERREVAEDPRPAGRRANELPPLHRPADDRPGRLEVGEGRPVIQVHERRPRHPARELGDPVGQDPTGREVPARRQGQGHSRVEVAAADPAGHVDPERDGQPPAGRDHDPVGLLAHQDDRGHHPVPEEDDEGGPEELGNEGRGQRWSIHGGIFALAAANDKGWPTPEPITAVSPSTPCRSVRRDVRDLTVSTRSV